MSTDTMTDTTTAGATEFAHMLLKVSDIERSERFYVDLLGFKVRPAKPLAGRTAVRAVHARACAHQWRAAAIAADRPHRLQGEGRAAPSPRG